MLLDMILKWVLFSSAMGSILALIILITKSISGVKLNANWHYYIWFLLLARLILPLAPQSSLSIANIYSHFQTVQKIELFQNNNDNTLVDNTRDAKINVPPTLQFIYDTSQPKNKDVNPNDGINI